MYFNFKIFIQMSLFIEQANQPNLSLPTTKTTEMIEINISYLHYFAYLWIFLKKKVSALWGRYRYGDTNTDTQKRPILVNTDTSAHH